MKEIVTVKYEAFDGKIFDEEIACLEHELKKYYDDCGIRFLDADEEKMDFEPDMFNIDYVYNTATYITIDREKEKENKLFVDYAVDIFGWILLKDLDLEFGLGTIYKMDQNELAEIDEFE